MFDFVTVPISMSFSASCRSHLNYNWLHSLLDILEYYDCHCCYKDLDLQQDDDYFHLGDDYLLNPPVLCLLQLLVRVLDQLELPAKIILPRYQMSCVSMIVRGGSRVI